jgi:hypothetical protein
MPLLKAGVLLVVNGKREETENVEVDDIWRPLGSSTSANHWTTRTVNTAARHIVTK